MKAVTGEQSRILSVVSEIKGFEFAGYATTNLSACTCNDASGTYASRAYRSRGHPCLPILLATKNLNISTIFRILRFRNRIVLVDISFFGVFSIPSLRALKPFFHVDRQLSQHTKLVGVDYCVSIPISRST